MQNKPSHSIDQSIEIQSPRRQVAFAMPKQTWDYLKERISNLTERVNLFHSIGMSCVGVFGSALTAAIVQPRNQWLWSVVVVAGVIGALSTWFGWTQRNVQRVARSEILTEMNLFERMLTPEEEPPSVSTTRAGRPSGRLVVIKAVYGVKDDITGNTGRNCRDVTDDVMREVRGDRLVLRVSNSQFGDPCIEQVKHLLLRYQYMGEMHSTWTLEGQMACVPPMEDLDGDDYVKVLDGLPETPVACERQKEAGDMELFYFHSFARDKILACFPMENNLAGEGTVEASSNYKGRPPEHILSGHRDGHSWCLDGEVGRLEVKWDRAVRCRYALLINRTSTSHADGWGRAGMFVNGKRVCVLKHEFSGKMVLVVDLGKQLEVSSLRFEIQGHTYPGLAGLELFL
ncbi:MAG: DUF3395 domain-containing protein [Planctomycetota bacterium]